MTKALELGAEVLREAIECLPDGFAIMEDNGKLIWCNQRSYAEFGSHYRAMDEGKSYEEAVEIAISRLVPDLTGEELKAAVRQIVSVRDSFQPMDLQTEEGRTASVVFRPMSNGRKVAVSVDVTELRAHERELVKARRRAEAANEAKSAFLANISHEIRTPLNGILGMAQVLAAGRAFPEQREQIATVLDSGKALMALLNDVLDLSKIEAGHLELMPSENDLVHVLRRLHGLWQPTAEEKNIELSLMVDATLPALLMFDSLRVRQCVSNLISNAIKFTQQGSVEVHVSAKSEDETKARIRIRIRDTGIGMDQDVLERLFHPFSQGDGSISRSFGGTGLGLSISKRLAEMMGGDITVTSEPGRGSTFTFTFVADTAAEAKVDRSSEAALAPLSGERSGTKGRLLVVDDHPVNRKIARLFLEQPGYKVTEACNGEEALTLLAAQTFDLVLLDIHMPVKDGLETLAEIRASKAPWRDLPVIALTADAMSGDREKLLRQGMQGYVSKPVDQRELLAEIERALKTSGQAALSRSAAG